MAAILPLAIQLLPLIPGLISSAMEVVRIVKADPTTPADVKKELDELEARLNFALGRVQSAPLPPKEG